MGLRRRRKTTWGGKRRGAGRPRYTKRVHHVKRPRIPRNAVVHVVLRMRDEVPSLRSARYLRALRETMRESSDRGGFRVVHYSVRRDHVNLIVEADDRAALAAGMKSMSTRVARAAHRVFAIDGSVLAGRYHLRLLRTPEEVREALAFVLLEPRARGTGRADPRSSAAWLDGWVAGHRPPRPSRPREVAAPRNPLLASRWRRLGLLDPRESAPAVSTHPGRLARDAE